LASKKKNPLARLASVIFSPLIDSSSPDPELFPDLTSGECLAKLVDTPALLLGIFFYI
jgi:hypothetical protein